MSCKDLNYETEYFKRLSHSNRYNLKNVINHINPNNKELNHSLYNRSSTQNYCPQRYTYENPQRHVNETEISFYSQIHNNETNKRSFKNYKLNLPAYNYSQLRVDQVNKNLNTTNKSTDQCLDCESVKKSNQYISFLGNKPKTMPNQDWTSSRYSSITKNKVHNYDPDESVLPSLSRNTSLKKQNVSTYNDIDRDKQEVVDSVNRNSLKYSVSTEPLCSSRISFYEPETMSNREYLNHNKHPYWFCDSDKNTPQYKYLQPSRKVYPYNGSPTRQYTTILGDYQSPNKDIFDSKKAFLYNSCSNSNNWYLNNDDLSDIPIKKYTILSDDHFLPRLGKRDVYVPIESISRYENLLLNEQSVDLNQEKLGKLILDMNITKQPLNISVNVSGDNYYKKQKRSLINEESSGRQEKTSTDIDSRASLTNNIDHLTSSDNMSEVSSIFTELKTDNEDSKLILNNKPTKADSISNEKSTKEKPRRLSKKHSNKSNTRNDLTSKTSSFLKERLKSTIKELSKRRNPSDKSSDDAQSYATQF